MVTMVTADCQLAQLGCVKNKDQKTKTEDQTTVIDLELTF